MFKDVSVVISEYSMNNVHNVIECIESIRRQSLLPREIILVLDPDRDLLKFYKSHMPEDVKIVVANRYGLSQARNAGVKESKSEIVAFIDDDAIADRNWLRNLITNYDDSMVESVGGHIKPLMESRRPAWFPEELFWIVGCSYKGLPEHKALVRNPIGCNMSFRKEIFKKVGFFRSNIGRHGKRLLAGEESDISIRIMKTIPNAKILYDPKVVVYHKVPKSRTTLKYVLKRSFYEGISKAIIKTQGSAHSLTLSTEKEYTRYLLRTSIPTRLRNPEMRNLAQLIVLFLSAWFVYTGFSIGILTRTES